VQIVLSNIYNLNRLKIIHIKTQVRRLKYFTVLIEKISLAGISKEILEQEIIVWSKGKHESFANYISSSGEIVESKNRPSSQSFKNYFECAKQLGLISEVNDSIFHSKIGYVFFCLKEYIPVINSSNEYCLSPLEKIFYLYVLINQDSDVLFSIINMLFSNIEDSLENLLKAYQQSITDRLNQKMNIISSIEYLKLLNTINRIKEWRSPIRYSEDIVPPRLNWFIDLGLIDEEYYLTTKKFKLNENGILFYLLVRKNRSFFDIDDDDLNCSYIQIINKVYFKNLAVTFDSLPEKLKEKLFHEIIIIVIKNFSVLGIPKIPLDQSLLFIALYFILKKNIIIEMEEIKNWIGYERKIGNIYLGIRMSARSYESYISIKYHEA
jgi:hypothetical protein